MESLERIFAQAGCKTRLEMFGWLLFGPVLLSIIIKLLAYLVIASYGGVSLLAEVI